MESGGSEILGGMFTRREVIGIGIGLASNSDAASWPPAKARKGMVATESPAATGVGVEILQRGGNAVDAAIAVALAEAVTHPSAGNIAGGGFMLIQMATGQAVVIDYREIAPRRATPNMFLGADGKPDVRLSTVGHLATGIPGTVAGLSLALKNYGTISWSACIAPAIRLAKEGFAVPERLANFLPRLDKLKMFPESRRIFLRDENYFKPGDILRQPELAATLQRMSAHGPDEFYQGETARLLTAEMSRNGGLIDMEDLASYRALEREPLRGTYRNHQIVSAPPAASGGTLLISMLNMLEGFDLTPMRQNSSARYHLLAEVMKRAFADRSEFIGDPAFTKAPIQGLISKSYAGERAKSIDPMAATPSSKIRAGEPSRHESANTTHFAVVDAMGNVVSNTYTLRTSFGSGVTVRGGGFLLNNVMDDFAAKPGEGNSFGFVAGEVNAVGAGKRPVSSQTPTVVNKGGRFWLALGAEGGPTIANSVLQVITNMVDHGMDLQQAVDAPRIHHQWMPDVLNHEAGGMAPEVIAAIEKRGHRMAIFGRGMPGAVNAVAVDPATSFRLGASDPRSMHGSAKGY